VFIKFHELRGNPVLKTKGGVNPGREKNREALNAQFEMRHDGQFLKNTRITAQLFRLIETQISLIRIIVTFNG
jgi:hypothetical protein